MPNWIQNKIVIGECVPEKAFQELLRAVETQRPDNPSQLPVSVDGDNPYQCFDFNSLIPMSKSLKVESGTRCDEAQAMIHIFDGWESILADYIMKCSSYREIFCGATAEDVKRDYRAISLLVHPDVFENKEGATAVMAKMNSWYQEAIKAVPFHGTSAFFDAAYSIQGRCNYIVNRLRNDINRAGINPQSYDAMKKFAETKEGARLLAFGKRLQENIKLYGFPTWYEWAIANWGTKWNADEPTVDTDQRAIMFMTAWSAPGGVAEAVAARFPNVNWKWFYADENWGNNAGYFIHEDGVLSMYKAEFASNEALEIYAELWGPSECMYQDEKGNWHEYDCDGTCPSHATCFGAKEANNE